MVGNSVTRTPAVACDRAELKTGIVHFGVGGFHRSHQQAYLDDLLRTQFDDAKEWCYTGVGVLEWDAKMRDYLKNNNWQYPIVSRKGPNPEEMEMHIQDVVSLRDMVLSFEDPAATVKLLASTAVRIVSLTITEFGYRVPLNEGDFKLVEMAFSGQLDTEICGDDIDPACRKATVFGLILASLALRYRTGVRPFTVMSCDNLPHNGEVAKKRVLSAIADISVESIPGAVVNEFALWLEEEVKYPSTMVDRITPATSPQDVADLKERAQIEDEWPVMCEPYRHWVIEDDFVDGARPSWEDVGALLVPDVRPHELLKVRLLNVTHSTLCYAGILAGCTHVHEAVTHKMIRPFLKRLMRSEIAASLRADPSMAELVEGLDATSELVLSRFENVAVKDTLDRIAMDGSEKFRVQGRAVVMEGLADERSVRGFALYVATWAHFLRKSVEAGDKVKDASAALVSKPWGENGRGLQQFLDIEEVFGVLAQHEGWRSAVAQEYQDITESGLEATLLGYIFGPGHNSNGDLASMGRISESRFSGTFALDEQLCALPIAEEGVDEAVAFVSLEA